MSEQVIVMQRRQFLKVEAILDSTASSNHDICRPDVAAVIFESLAWMKGRNWKVWAACLMRSHIHVVLRNVGGDNGSLRTDLASFMSFSARKINALLGLSGSFWQGEPFDHWCRDALAWERSVAYTLNNPVKARLCSTWSEWPYSIADPEAVDVVKRKTGKDIR